jgi:uncharacterized DUF497 family protein
MSPAARRNSSRPGWRGVVARAGPKRYMARMEFGWDEAKHQRNIRERGFGFDYATLIFKGDTAEWIDDRRDYGEERIRAIGLVGRNLLHVVYTVRGDVCWIISARPASRKERREWRDTH